MSTAPVIPAPALQDYVLQYLDGERGTWCGGSAGAADRCSRHPGVPEYEFAYGDIDWFASSMVALSAACRRLIENGAVPADEEEAFKWEGWNQRDPHWHTNSLRLVTKEGAEFNMVLKSEDGHILRTGREQIGSFDFSNVSMGLNTATGEPINLFHAYWWGGNPDQVRMLPDRRIVWEAGRFTKFPGIRQADRWARNVERGYDMRATIHPLVSGYRITTKHYGRSRDPEEQAYAQVYKILADMIEDEDARSLRMLYDSISPDRKIEEFSEVLMLA